MEFKLKEMAGPELREYTVITRDEYDIDNPQGSTQENIYPMLIYKKTLKTLLPGNDGIREVQSLNGKIEKIYPLKNGDTIEIEGQRYTVTEIMPRIYGDFQEFNLEVQRNGQ